MTLGGHALRSVPNALTCLGHVLTLAWLSGAPWPVGIAGLACNARERGRRVSGRALLTGVALAIQVAGGSRG